MGLVECVPKISDGRRPEVYEAAARAAASAPGVTVLNVDPGAKIPRAAITSFRELGAGHNGVF